MTSEELTTRIQTLKTQIEGLSDSEVNQRRRKSFQEVEQAVISSDSAVKERGWRKLEALEKELGLDLSGKSQLGMWGFLKQNSMLLVSAAAVVVVAGILMYAIRKLGPSTFQTVEGGRALLLVALTVAFVVYGGALIIYPMFASGDVSQRFRYSREVFLMLSGIFSTVVGFYFAQTGSSSNTIEMVAVASPTKDGAELSILGGTPPYTIEIKKSDSTVEKRLVGAYGTISIPLPVGESTFIIVDTRQTSKLVTVVRPESSTSQSGAEK
jgi:hypothetical protein